MPIKFQTQQVFQRILWTSIYFTNILSGNNLILKNTTTKHGWMTHTRLSEQHLLKFYSLVELKRQITMDCIKKKKKARQINSGWWRYFDRYWQLANLFMYKTTEQEPQNLETCPLLAPNVWVKNIVHSGGGIQHHLHKWRSSRMFRMFVLVSLEGLHSWISSLN